MLQRNALRGSFRRVVGGGVWLLTILLIGSSLIRTARTAQATSFQQDRAGASVAATAVAATAVAATGGVETSTLEPGRSIEREISSGQTHSYRIALDAGKYLRVHVEQQGIDVTVSLLARDGKVVAESKSD